MFFILSTDNCIGFKVSPPKQHTVTFKLDAEVEPTLEFSPVVKSPRSGKLKQKTHSQFYTFPIENVDFAVMMFFLLHQLCLDLYVVRGKAKLSQQAAKQVEEGKRLTDKISGKQEESTVDGSLVAATSPISSPISRSPLKGEQKLSNPSDNFHIYPIIG